ncbi:unnamed protein product [Schistocephalus solidus]|uniref:Leishmanolysin-like peptidase n=1 Tax=Schistocephalus solidus TaxID=70667 RepID=A0A183SAP4_SCHSO|nr:unnamed protein product [Schistocephalus solidus]
MNLLLVLLWLFRTNMTCIQAICLSPGPENSEVVRFVPLAAFAPNRPRRSPRPPLLFGVHLDASFRTLPFSKVLEVMNFSLHPCLQPPSFLDSDCPAGYGVLANDAFACIFHPPDSPSFLCRQCVGGNVGFVQEEDSSKNRPISFCIQGCEPITRCGPVHVPPEHLHSCRNASNPHLMPSDMPQTGGPNFRIYVSALSSAQCDKSEASIGFAAHCQQESQTDRPIAGFINFCPRELLRKHAQTAELTYFVKHEMLHILGFSSSLYAFFRGPTGEPLTPRQLFPPNPNLGWFDQSRYVSCHNLFLLTNLVTCLINLLPARRHVVFRGVYKWSEGVIKLVVRNWTSSCGVFPKVAHLLRTPTVLVCSNFQLF